MPDFVQAPRPFDQLRGASTSGEATARAVERRRKIADAKGLGAIDAVARDEPLDGHRARVLVDRASEEVVEHAEPQRAADRVDALDPELLRPPPP